MMNPNNRNARHTFRNKALVGAIVAALALGAAGTASAQTSSDTLTPNPTWSQTLQLLNYLHSVNNTQTLTGNVGASLSAGNSIFDNFSGTGTANPQTVSNNSLFALAKGNSAIGTVGAPNANDRSGNAIALELLGADSTVPVANSGLGILSGQLNSGNTVSASASGVSVETKLTGYAAGSATQNSNEIRADVRMNDASSQISGNLPATTFAGTTAGSAAISYTVPTSSLQNAGDLSVGNAQVNVGTIGSGATLSTSSINVDDSVGSAASFSNSDNTIAASYVGNTGASSVNASGANGAPSYNGSVVVSNGQANLNAPSTTTMDGNTITTTVNGNLTGSITQSGDSISGATQGNTATNAISFADGISIAGTSGAAASTLSLAFGSGTVTSNGAGDLVLLNAQGNQASTSFVTGISGTTIGAVAAGVTTAASSVTVHDDHVSASTGGNTATNGISTNGASFNGLVSAGNQQVNDNARVQAGTSGVQVGAKMAGVGNSLGDISVDASSIGASAQGNQASTVVDVAGTSFKAGGGALGGVAKAETTVVGTNNIGVDTGNAGVSVGNVQANYGNAITNSASNTDSWLAAYYAGSLTGGSSTVSGNTIGASAGGNAATTSAALSGSNGEFSAALANSQYNANNISGTLGTARAGVEVKGSSTNATLTTNSNSLSVSANGNQGSNSLSSDFTNATLGDGTGTWAAPSTDITNFEQSSPKENQSHAALALASTQWSDGSTMTATDTNGQVGVLVETNLTNTPVTVNDNSASASAVSNQVSNTVDPGVGNLSTVGGVAAQVASLSNLQHANGNDVTAEIGLLVAPGDDPAMIGAVVGGNISASATTVSNNSVSAFAAGSMADNGMAITGTNYAPADVTGTNGLGIREDNGATTATAAFTVLNGQDSEGNARTASVTGGTMGAITEGSITNSPLTVNGNHVSADARDNYVNNNLSFGGFSSLNTTAAMLTEQFSYNTPVLSVIQNTNIYASSTNGNVSGSDFTLGDNALTAKAIGNTGINALTVQGGQLAGNSTDYPGLAGLRGAVWNVNYPAAPANFPVLTSTDYGLENYQYHTGAVTASVINGQIGAAAFGTATGGSVNGGSLTVDGNAQTAFAQANTVANSLNLDATSTTASAAVNNFQTVHESSTSMATVTTDFSFFAYAGVALGTSTVLPVTVSDNAMVAQAGLSTASNALNVHATSAINGNGLIGARASTDSATYGGYSGALADFAVNSFQSSYSGATAIANAGLVGIEAAGGGIGRNGTSSGLTVSGNQVAAQASVNNVSNAINLTGASSISATTALTNDQNAHGNRTGVNQFLPAAVNATVSATHVGVFDNTSANITNAKLSVSGNSLNAGASGNSANNAINVQAVALNTGIAEATKGSTSSVLNATNVGYPRVFGTAMASNSLLNAQVNEDTISATVSNSNIGVDPGLPGGTSALLNSTATVGGNSASASASGNSAGNQILLASLPTGVASSSLVSNQVNTTGISATATNVMIGINAGATSSSSVTVSGNTISATAIGNSAMNHIGIGN